MITMRQARRVESFAKHVTVVEQTIPKPPDWAEGQPEPRVKWAYGLFIEIEGERGPQGYGATFGVTERSMDALSECITQFWLQLQAEGVIH